MGDRIVIDASVAIKWFLRDETGIARAEDLLTEILASRLTAVAPAHMPFELCNGMRRAVGLRRITRDDANDAISDFFDIPVQIGRGNRFYYQKTLDVSLEHKLIAQDAAYLALAASTGSSLATGDKQLAAAAEMAGVKTIRIGI